MTVAEMELRIAELEAKNLDLENRLRNFNKIDEFNADQKVEALKANIERLLRLDHKNYQFLKDEKLSKDNYESLQIVIRNIFKSLRKNGIEFGEDK